jgi:sentrin-specific protease 8
MCQSQFATPSYRSNLITHIFLPLNDDTLNDHSRRGPGTIGGHWSLLVVSLIDNVAFHYDSMRGHNATQADILTRKISEALPVPRQLRFVQMSVSDAPQQSDGSNCGTFVCVIMKHLLTKRLLRADANQKVTMSRFSGGAFCTMCRDIWKEG